VKAAEFLLYLNQLVREAVKSYADRNKITYDEAFRRATITLRHWELTKENFKDFLKVNE
jgi:hypothetical protein